MSWTRKKSRPKLDTPDLLDLAERSTRLDNGEMLDAMDITLSNLCRYLPEFRRTRQADYLGEISMAAQALYVMAEEMATRAGARASEKPTRQTSSRSYD
jgi:hypothetical protein